MENIKRYSQTKSSLTYNNKHETFNNDSKSKRDEGYIEKFLNSKLQYYFLGGKINSNTKLYNGLWRYKMSLYKKIINGRLRDKIMLRLK